MSTMVRAYTTCVTAVAADQINIGPLDEPEYISGAQAVQIRIGATKVEFPWTNGPLPRVGAVVTINIETA